MTIRILNYSPELLRRLRGLVEVEGSDLLLDISDPVPLRSFAGLSSDRVYRQWSTQNGIYFILRQQRVADIGMSAPDDPTEGGLSGRVSVHACSRLVRANRSIISKPRSTRHCFWPMAVRCAPGWRRSRAT